MLGQFKDFSGCFPFFADFEGHNGKVGFMQIDDQPDALIGSELESFEKKRGNAASAFASGRRCIRALQEQLDLPQFELPTGEFGPVWPSDLVGSISHSRELVAASIVRDAVGVGIDIEYRRRLRVDAARKVATRKEYFRYSAIPDFDWTLLFSAKESVFKALSPLTRCYIGFQEVELLLDTTTQSFSVRYVGNAIDKGLFERSEGHWSALADHLMTLVMVN